MIRRTHAWTGATIALALTALVGCASTAPEAEPSEPHDVQWSSKGDDVYEKIIKLDDGREVSCLIYDAGYKRGAGISCDWVSAGER